MYSEDGVALGDTSGKMEGEGEGTCSGEGATGKCTGDGDIDDGEGVDMMRTGDGADAGAADPDDGADGLRAGDGTDFEDSGDGVGAAMAEPDPDGPRTLGLGAMLLWDGEGEFATTTSTQALSSDRVP